MRVFVSFLLASGASAYRVPAGLRAGAARGPRSAMMSTPPRRDAQGYIVEEDLAFDLRAGVSKALGASMLKEVPPPIQALLEQARAAPESHRFADTMAAIDAAFEFFGTKFVNGDIASSSSENTGSSKILSLAQLVAITKEEVLALFGEHYRDVLADPDGTSHANIRAFMKKGNDGVVFPNGPSLTPRKGAWDGQKYSSDAGIAESSVVIGEGEWDVDSDVWIP